MWFASSSVRVVKVVTVRGVPAALSAASATAKRTHLTCVAIPALRSAPKSRLRASSLIMQAMSCHLCGFLAFQTAGVVRALCGARRFGRHGRRVVGGAIGGQKRVIHLVACELHVQLSGCRLSVKSSTRSKKCQETSRPMRRYPSIPSTFGEKSTIAQGSAPSCATSSTSSPELRPGAQRAPPRTAPGGSRRPRATGRRTAGAPRRARTRNAIQAAMGEMTSGVSFAGELTRRDTA
jgi:hypothetical protein